MTRHPLLFVPALVVCLALSTGSLAAQRDTAAAPVTDTVPGGALVTFGRDSLFRLFGDVGSFTPDDRAAALQRRLEVLAADPRTREEDIRVVDSVGQSAIRLGEATLVTITDADAAGAGLPRAAAAERYAGIIREALQRGEVRVSIRSLALGVLWTVLATLVLVLLFRGFSKLFPRLERTLEGWRGTRIPALRIQRLELLSATRLTDALIAMVRVVRIVAVVLVLYVYVPLVLSFFPWTRGLSGRLIGYIVEPVGNAWRALLEYLPSLVTLVVLVVLFRYALKFIRVFFQGIQSGTITLPNFPKDWADPTYKIVRFLVLVFAAIAIYPYLPGSDTAAFQGISVFLGVLISFGSSSAIANVVAGVVMTYMRPFQIGDRVKIADTVGDVAEKTLLVTRIRTIKNEDITVPNAMVLSSHIINYSSTARNEGLILHTSVTIGYDVPWKQVHALLLDAAGRTEHVVKDPPPFVLQTSLNDHAVAYELNAYTDAPNRMAQTYSGLHEHIQDAFNEAGVEIMSPLYLVRRASEETTIPPQYRTPAE
jgi:small-conductance mechanosensitive channel